MMSLFYNIFGREGSPGDENEIYIIKHVFGIMNLQKEKVIMLKETS